jgi:site-specific DNA recombinase
VARRRSRSLQSIPTGGGRVLLYVRVSALMGRSGDDFHSPDVQLDGMRNLIGREGLREVAVIDDDIDESGQSFDRPGIKRIRDMVESRQVDVIAVFALNRVGRNLSESLEFIKWLRKHGVVIISANEKIDDTPEGQFMLGMWLNMAELQGNQIGAAWSRVIARRATTLGIPAGNVNQGYLKGPEGRYVVDPILGPAMTAAFTAYAEGTQITAITNVFAELRGRHLATSAMKAMLRNPVYRGRVVVNSATSGLIDVEGKFPPLVDEHTWQRVQRRMQRDRTVPPRHLQPAHSLTGLGRCAGCNRNLQVTCSYEHGRNNPTRRLYCKRGKELGNCEGVGMPRYDPIEAALIGSVREYADRLRGNPGAVARQRARTAQARVDAGDVERELANTRQAIARLTERWARGGLEDAEYDETLAGLRATRDLQAAALERAQEVMDMPDPAQVVKLVDRMMQLWPEMTEAERNQTLRSVVRSFAVRRPVAWREPPEELLVDVDFRW